MTDVENDDIDAEDSGQDDDPAQDDDANQAIAPTAVAVMTYLARAVVEDADAVRVEAQQRGRRVRISVFAAPNDFGRLIGRRGRVAAALRTVVGAAAAKDGFDAEVEFVE